jgi:hypothetical protein
MPAAKNPHDSPFPYFSALTVLIHQDFTAHKVFGMGVSYWDGSGPVVGTRVEHFRDGTRVQGNLVANWTVCRNASDQSVCVQDVYEDPYFSRATRLTIERDERLIDPADARRGPDPGGQTEKGHKYNSHLNTEGRGCTVTDGRWCPIWLLCRTKTGWWAICWEQLPEAHPSMCWYDDRHVHLLDVRR